MIRITTGGVLKSYRTSLNNAYIRFNDSVNTVLSTRLFNSYAENPSSASQAFQVRRSILNNQAQITVCSSVKGKYDQAYNALSNSKDSIADNITNSAKYGYLRAGNDPIGDARTTMAKAFTQQAESLIQCMNTTYGDTFVFAGADGLNVPFELRDDGKLYYRGVAVDTAVPDVITDSTGNKITLDANRNYDASGNGTNYIVSNSISTTDKAAYDAASANGDDVPNVLTDASGSLVEVDENGVPTTGGGYYLLTDDMEPISQTEYEQAEADLAKLDYMSHETYYVDIGLGFQWNSDNNSLVNSSGFNAALQGINFVGYGVDEDGDPKNIITLMMRLGDICANYTEETWGDVREEYDRLCTKFEDAMQRFDTAWVEESATKKKLDNAYDLLDDKQYTLNVQLSELEDVDEAEALSDFLYAQYCYNAALKVGNSILSPSLIDYVS